MKVDEEIWVFDPRFDKYQLGPLECIRAIRTRTVDLLGKTEKTYYYRNDSNCFKDPTCILLHWALSSTDVKIS